MKLHVLLISCLGTGTLRQRNSFHVFIWHKVVTMDVWRACIALASILSNVIFSSLT